MPLRDDGADGDEHPLLTSGHVREYCAIYAENRKNVCVKGSLDLFKWHFQRRPLGKYSTRQKCGILEASRTVATYSGVIHNNVYLAFVCYNVVNDHFDGGVIGYVEREKLDRQMAQRLHPFYVPCGCINFASKRRELFRPINF